MSRKKSKLTHVDDHGAAHMVDIGAKTPSRRTAVAAGQIRMQAATLAAIRDNAIAKGDVLTVAKIAGISAAKRTSEWIPLCHPLPIDVIDLALSLDQELPGVRVRARSAVEARTGAEMEALIAVTTALLTIYDMCKAVDREMEIGAIRLLEKSGGRGGTWKSTQT
ncbi:MAG: cyclic pyranopterin monophosphate synthase MoaC [Gemmatimonadota bacterium]|nr:MAG: cyclic pyranopterin monophosphate synthase MoaC [Gemmatimonadota bacterium]